jgi:SAM-dependent methyltransferase
MTTSAMEEVEAFVGLAGQELGAAASVAMAVLGDRLGLYRAMVDQGALTPAELAARSGLAERYVREWAANQAAGGWLHYEPETGGFSLPDAHAAVLADETSPAFLGGSIQATAAIFRSLDRLAEVFRTGEGIGWGEHHEDLHAGAARFFRTACAAALPGWVETLEQVAGRLRAGGSVLDLGCGRGGAAIALGLAFPAARIAGVDSHGASIERARAAAAAEGLADRVTFQIADVTAALNGRFDLVMMLDTLHDLGDPVAAASRAREALTADGAVLLVEPFAGDRLEENFNPVGRMYFASSTAFCTPSALAQAGGWALGNQVGETRLRDICAQAGLNDVWRVGATPYQLVLAARP